LMLGVGLMVVLLETAGRILWKSFVRDLALN
jgi:hypothetical protein